MSTEDQVRQASKKFYTALNQMANGNPAPMADVWSHSAGVTTMHPIGGREVGWDAVKGPLQLVSQLASSGEIVLRDQHLQVSPDMAYEVGTEQGHFKLAGEELSVEHRVTNVYRLEGGEGKIVHHHTDLSPAMVDVISHLQS